MKDEALPTKEKNEEIFLTQVFKKFQSFQPGEQQFYINEINKLFEGNYTVALQEPIFNRDHHFRGRPKGSKRKHKSISSTKRDPSGFENTDLEKKKRGRPKKEVTFADDKVSILFPCYLILLFSFSGAYFS